MAALSIRLATADDLPAINSIYNHYVFHSTATYQLEPTSAAERESWFEAHDEMYPVTVIERGGEVVGWGALNEFRARRAYRPTVENSVYIRHDLLGQGIGKLLLADLIERAKAIGYHSIIAGISADQQPSVKLHARMGFVTVATLREVGWKFGYWLDVVYMQLMLHVDPAREVRP